ncbi:hypothetical protein SDC9_127667 [bioreactor metagenome]|uniref:HTH cro/C1-type domain-containing protein n=1 Tax=bioreactor metagenome TaxID=1076179 RepID=A0A645CUL2_9ZZZZ|nr:hypothetical protein [Erysipelotrichaceae bacterium]
MTDSKRLLFYMRISNTAAWQLAEKLNITTKELDEKLNNQMDFTVSEIRITCEVLNIPINERSKVFFYEC